MDIKSVTITLTRACNLACVYCYEHNKDSESISFETAKSIIDYEFANLSENQNIELSLFGGEPFLEFDLIKSITAYIRTKKEKDRCTIFITTNGTLIHGEIKDWLVNNRDLCVCGLSLYGTREMHNVNRSNSYDDIDIEFFLKQYGDQGVKMTISIESLPSLFEGVKAIQEKGFHVWCNLAYGIEWDIKRDSIILERELNKLIDFYLGNPEILPCSILDMKIKNIATHENVAYKYCGCGTAMSAYDINGKRYPCQYFMPLSIGDKKANEAMMIEFPEGIIPEDKLDDKCKNCVIRSVCINCYGSNYNESGSIYKRNDTMCELTKIIAKANSYFIIQKWKNNLLEENNNDVNLTLMAALKIQENLS